eukprot:Pgem_evm1s15530
MENTSELNNEIRIKPKNISKVVHEKLVKKIKFNKTHDCSVSPLKPKKQEKCQFRGCTKAYA